MSETLVLPADYPGQTPHRELLVPQNLNGLLVHCCCAPCALAILECLLWHGIRPVLFFYNPNISPRAEYERRRTLWQRLADTLELAHLCADYDPPRFRAATTGLEDEPERGARCARCFALRLEVTAQTAAKLELSHFTSTLAASRWKSRTQVDEAGYLAAAHHPGVHYWDEDWRRHGLGPRREALVRASQIYNQRYCGCPSSLRDAAARAHAAMQP